MGSWLRSAFWWVPLLFSVLVAGAGTYTYRALADATRENLREELETILHADVAALGFWVDTHKTLMRTVAADPRVREHTLELLEIARVEREPGEQLSGSSSADALRIVLEPLAVEYGYRAYAVLDTHGVVLAARHGFEEFLGDRVSLAANLFNRALSEPAISAPILDPAASRQDEAIALLRAGTPILGEDGETIAILGFSIPADGAFTEVLQIARAGESGETYAFDRNGLLLSRSRFEAQLVELGLLEAGAPSLLNIHIRDPGGDLTTGFKATLPPLARPLTRMAASAVTGEAGSDIVGYPDYRGVPVVGAWQWLPELDLGVTTEIDVAEAYAGLATVRRSFAGLAALLALASLGMLAYSVLLGRAQKRYEAVRQLGRYRILEKIGEGGMGKVYRAEHALLRRPTAVKLLEAERATGEAAARFEREVQATARLSHPNTISVYDYGRTPDGAFYFAMEYLEGVTVSDLVAFDGAQSEARVMHFLTQAAASLAEAHAMGLVHRDIKPSNVMVCSRGGMLDIIKVLDFGLVRAKEEDLNLTSTQTLTGTPQYLSPEALKAPDTVAPSSDVYQLGAVAYYLITGRHVFAGDTLVEILSAHLHNSPIPPSEALGHAIDPSLEKLVLACLSKDAAKRPRDGGELLTALQACDVNGAWRQEDAKAWWDYWAREHPTAEAPDDASGSLPSGWDVELGGRMTARGDKTRG